MARVGIVSRSKKFGSADDQRGVIGQMDVEWDDGDVLSLFANGAIRPGDTVHIAHAAVLGRYQQREKFLMAADDMEIKIAIGGADPERIETPEQIAKVHGDALKPTGKGTAKQKRLRGRPLRYPKPDDDDLTMIAAWWDGPQNIEDVETLAGQRMRAKGFKGKKIPKATLYEWMGRGRAAHPDRRRRRRKTSTK